MFNFDTLKGMTLESLGEFMDAQDWEYGWVMDELYVSDRPDHWVWIGFHNGVVCKWEAV